MIKSGNYGPSKSKSCRECARNCFEAPQIQVLLLHELSFSVYLTPRNYDAITDNVLFIVSHNVLEKMYLVPPFKVKIVFKFKCFEYNPYLSIDKFQYFFLFCLTKIRLYVSEALCITILVVSRLLFNSLIVNLLSCMSVTAKPLMGLDPANSNALNGPMDELSTKEAVPAGGLSPENCDRKGSTIISNHVDVVF